MRDGFVKIAALSPQSCVARPRDNAKCAIEAVLRAEERSVKVALFSELYLSGATAGDLFFQTELTRGSLEALFEFAKGTENADVISFIGLPFSCRGALYNAVAAVFGGKILGIIPKSHLTREDARYFAPAPDGIMTVSLLGEEIPFGTDIIFGFGELRIACEIGDELRSPLEPAALHALAGATVILNPAARAATVTGDMEYRADVSAASRRLSAAYVRCEAGDGESGTDGFYSAHSVIAERGNILAEGSVFSGRDAVCTIDLEKIIHDRKKSAAFSADASGYALVDFQLKNTECDFDAPKKSPFIPDDDAERVFRCERILEIQARSLAKRMERAHARGLVIGVSGGLDSTLALLVCARALDVLGLPRERIIAVTMPCFGTTSRTRTNAERLSESLGASLRTVDIKRAVGVHFEDIGHSADEHTAVYENAQARERTQVLMDIANAEGGLVVGTGDLSELALGFATYNGDHISMYGVNAAVPKTLIRHITEVCADKAARGGDGALSETLRDILNTPVSPELLPPRDGEIAQCTEGLVGPYELHDYFIYYFVRYGFSPKKILRMAEKSFAGDYTRSEILHWLRLFVSRFFSQQFKRSCLPDGPLVGSVGFSPRGGWVMPSDASAALWLDAIDGE